MILDRDAVLAVVKDAIANDPVLKSLEEHLKLAIEKENQRIAQCQRDIDAQWEEIRKVKAEYLKLKGKAKHMTAAVRNRYHGLKRKRRSEQRIKALISERRRHIARQVELRLLKERAKEWRKQMQIQAGLL